MASGILLFGQVSGKSNQDEKSLVLFVEPRITIVYILDGKIKEAFMALCSGGISDHFTDSSILIGLCQAPNFRRTEQLGWKSHTLTSQGHYYPFLTRLYCKVSADWLQSGIK